MKDLPEELQHESYRRRANRRVSDGMPTEKRGGAPAGFKRLRGELNALTVTSAAPREFIHPVADRALTLRECARLQSFPDSFRFTGNAMSVARQIGNAIPPLAGRVLAEAIMREDGHAGADVGRARGEALGLIGFHLTVAEGMSPALAKTAASLRSLMNEGAELPLLRRAYG
jgi:DNA (cytosine-5)-methyltransferase 1